MSANGLAAVCECGMAMTRLVLLHEELDAVTGRRIGNRLRSEAARCYDTDKRLASANGNRLRSLRKGC